MKLWAAMMVFDMEHRDNENLTPFVVNNGVGRDLMSFSWLKDKHSIEAVPEKWQFIPDHSEKNTKEVGIIHWTEGGPYYPAYRDVKFNKQWFDEYERYIDTKVEQGRKGLEEMLDGS
jgi:hypothetical protein